MSAKTDKSLSTGEVAKLSSFTREQIYSYLNAGLIKAAGRTPTGRLRFHSSCIERLRLLQQLNESGYTLRDIRETFKTAFRS